jgi:hypothetical protein
VKRLAALVAAAALVAVAFVLRGAIDDEGPGGGGTTAPSEDPAASEPVAPTEEVTALVCITELRSLCAELAAVRPGLDVTVEDAGATLDRLAGLDDPTIAPLWLTVAPYPAMVDALRGADAPLGYDAETLAASPLAIAVPADGRAGVLETACAGGARWPCIGDHAGDPWSDLGGDASWATLRPSFGDVDGSALALASFAGAVGGYTGSPSFDAADWSSDVPALRALARASSRAPNSGGTPLATMATGRAVDLAASADFELAGLGGGAERFTLVYPDQGMWMEAVLAAPTGAPAPEGLAADLAELLTAAGWDAAPAGGPGLPAAPVMLELRELWGELT